MPYLANRDTNDSHFHVIDRDRLASSFPFTTGIPLKPSTGQQSCLNFVMTVYTDVTCERTRSRILHRVIPLLHDPPAHDDVDVPGYEV